jgi:hypothetical protein
MLVASVTSAVASTANVEFKPTSGACSNTDKIFAGTLTIQDERLSALLKAADGEIVTFQAPIAKNGAFKTRFAIKSGDGFDMEGKFDGMAGHGTWESKTLSCAGNWKAI